MRGRITIWLLLLPALGACKPEPLIISTVPYTDSADLHKAFGPLARAMSERLKRPVEFETRDSYAAVLDALAADKIDVAFVGAAAYLEAREKGTVRAILTTVRHGDIRYRGAIIVPRKSKVTSIAELKGTKIAFADPLSTAGFLAARRLFAAFGIDVVKDVEAIFAGTHKKVVEMVAAGEVAAGACFDGAQKTLKDPRAVALLAYTDTLPNDPVVVRFSLSPSITEAVRKTLVAMTTAPEAKAFFEATGIEGFVPAFDSDYDEVAKLFE